MAKRRRSARQRQALRKAQLVSARNRSRKGKFLKGAKLVGQVAGGIAVSAAVYHANEYARHPDKAVKHAKMAHGFVTKKAPKPAARSRPAKRIGYYPSARSQRASLRRRR